MGSPGSLTGLLLKGLPPACGPPEPEQQVPIDLHQMSKMMGPLDLARLGPTGANIVTQVCGCVEEEEG